ncbi:MAG TPA: hypothetical protein DC054_13915, partial [Blastocatellia bacterium]|nr:hypothetical protein [Blastocatellia bacterium]
RGRRLPVALLRRGDEPQHAGDRRELNCLTVVVFQLAFVDLVSPDDGSRQLEVARSVSLMRGRRAIRFDLVCGSLSS